MTSMIAPSTGKCSTSEPTHEWEPVGLNVMLLIEEHIEGRGAPPKLNVLFKAVIKSDVILF